MTARASLIFLFCLCAASARALTLSMEPADVGLPPAHALHALDGLRAAGTSPAAIGRLFDAALARRDAFAVVIPDVPPPAFERTFRRLTRDRSTNGYDEMISSYSARHGLDPRLVKAVVAAESEFNRRAKSPAGALGLMQVMPVTAASVGVRRADLFNPEANIRAGTAYLAVLFARAWKRYRLDGADYVRAPQWLIQRVIAAYNAGPRFLARRPMYRQTRDYVRRVIMFYRSAVTLLTV